MKLPLIILAGLSIIAGWVDLPSYLGHVRLFSNFLDDTLPFTELSGSIPLEIGLAATAVILSFVGILLAYAWYLRHPVKPSSTKEVHPLSGRLEHFFGVGWGFDDLYHNVFVVPYVKLARVNQRDFLDSIYQLIAWLTQSLHRLLSQTQTGRMRWYSVGIGLGAVLLLALAVL